MISIVLDWLNHDKGGSGTASGDGGEVNRAPAKRSSLIRGVSEPDEDEKDPFLLRAIKHVINFMLQHHMLVIQHVGIHHVFFCTFVYF